MENLINKLRKEFIYKNRIKNFLETHDRNEWYKSYKIPKRNGGWREINEPIEELKTLQKDIMNYLNTLVQPKGYTYAYRKYMSAIDAANVHKENKYVYFFDIHDFFGSINLDLLREQVTQKFKNIISEEDMELIYKIALINYPNSLPQGSPLSPYLSNLVLDNFDIEIAQIIIKLKAKYTRYADDIIISSKQGNLLKYIKHHITELLPKQLQINKTKTKVLKITNRLYILGVKLNKDNQLTYGHEKKQQLKLDIYNMFINKLNNTLTKEEAQEVLGRFSYMSQIEPQYAEYLTRYYLKKFNIKEKTLYQYFL